MKCTNLLIALALTFCTTVLTAQSLEGVWKMTSHEYVSPEGTESMDPAQPGLLIISGDYYSMAAVMADEERPLLPVSRDWEDAELMQKTFGAYMSNSGTYTIAGNNLTLTPHAALSPNVMHDGNTLSTTFTLEGNVLNVIIPRGPEGENTWTIVMERVQ